jgi:tight adherence protein B
MPGHVGLRPWRMMQRAPTFTPMAVLVQQSAALLRGGRAPARLWDELWLLYGGRPSPALALSDAPRSGSPLPDATLSGALRPLLAPLSRASLVAARAAAGCGAPVGAAIRGAAAAGAPGAGAARRNNAAARERGAWIEFAACFDIAEASGSPLADVLARFAAQLEAEDDAEAARQSAFAGPRATVRLLSWLPVLGLGLGVALGVDPLGILLGEPAGFAALVAGVALTAAGRIWSAKLVRSATRQPK